MSLPTFSSISLWAAGAPVVNIVAWLLFGLLVFVLVGIDLFAIHRKGHEPSLVESAVTVAAWCLLALGFNGLVWWLKGGEAAVQFATGYLLEWSMSMDNVFVFVVIFRFFQVPKEHQYRILFWGILGAIVLRLGFILAGSALISQFNLILPLFGLFLIYTAYRLIGHDAQDIDPSRTLVFRLARRWLAEGTEQGAGSTEQGLDGTEQKTELPAPSSVLPAYSDRFFVRQRGRLRITPLFLVLLIVETSDLVFAVDSIPAIFGITRDSFIVFTSNVFAILGLRALYFLLAGVMDSFRYLHYGLAAVLAFVGLKMVAEPLLPQGKLDQILPPWTSLATIVLLLGIAIVASLAATKREKPRAYTRHGPN